MIELFNKEIFPIYIKDYEEYKQKIGVNYIPGFAMSSEARPEYEQMIIELWADNYFNLFCGDITMIYINNKSLSEAEKVCYDYKGQGYYLIGFRFNDHLADPNLNNYECITYKYTLKEFINDFFKLIIRYLQKL